MQIKSIRLENFKDVRDETYLFGDYTKVSGRNGLGKTTIADAWYWLIKDRNYELESNPDIRPDDGRECTPTVTAVLDVDGVEITISKLQRAKKSKEKDGKPKISNSYIINAVEKNETSFKNYMTDLGFSFDDVLYCSNPLSFMEGKVADMRKYLFQMTSEKTDYDIALMVPETKEATELLKNYTFEEVAAMNKSTIKKIAEVHGKDGELTRAKIEGLELSKVDIDTAELELAKKALEEKLAEIDGKIANSGNAVSDLMSEEMQLQMDMSVIMQNMNKELLEKRKEAEDGLRWLENEIKGYSLDISNAEKQISENKTAIETAEKKRAELGAEYKAAAERTFDESKWVFDENSTICSLCGQTLPEDKIAEIKADFESRKGKAKDDFIVQKNSDMEEIKAQGFKQKHLIEELTAENTSLLEDISNLEVQKQIALEKQNSATKKLEELPTEADYSQSEEYVKLKARHDEVKAKIDSLKSSTDVAEAFKAERKAVSDELETVKAEIAKSFNNVRIDEQIEELQKKQRDFEQAKADAEKILHQLKLIAQKKEDILTDEINKHFSVVKWVLFSNQKNGERVQDCYPTACNDKGEFKKWEHMNGALKVKAKLDICYSFQKFFNMHYPIFLDEAAEVNSWNIPRNDDTQLITLNVTEDKKLKVEVLE